MATDSLIEALLNTRFQPVMDVIANNARPHVMDLTASNPNLRNIDLNDEHSFSHFIEESIKNAGAYYGIGGYGEDRMIYTRSEVFGTARSIHLGVDIWTEAGSPVYCPMDGTVHSFADNNSHGDYGPTIILRHEIEHHIIYSLYGHLSRSSISGITIGMEVNSGTRFAALGSYDENVHWPPHLHFQIIRDLGDKRGDYPGVCARSEQDFYLQNCPDPNLILQVPSLK